METEITPAAATNGEAGSGENVATKQVAITELEAASSSNTAGRLAEEEAAATAATTTTGAADVYMEEGNTATPTEDDEMGEAEYLEDEDENENDEESYEAADKAIGDKEQPAATVDKPVEEAAVGAAEQSAEPEDEATAKDAEAKKVAEGEDDIIEEPEEEAGDGDDEGELIVGDDAEQALAVARSGGQKQEEPVDENQCRVCTNKEQLVSLFNKVDKAITPADLLMSICPNVSIALKDFMPQFICSTCLASLTIAIQLRTQLEDTERDLRKRLSRSKNKVRRPRGYVVIDAPVSDSASDEDEELNDEEFKVSDEEAVSTSPDTVSSDSDASEKRKPGRKRGRKKGSKRAAGSNSDEEFQKKKSSLQLPAHGPFECDQCELTFARKQSYIMHRKTHDSRQLYSCQICQKKFKVQGAYRTHMERHAQERAHFRCELCPQVFKLRVELKRHMAMRHDEHGVMYECKRCQRTFLTQQRLQRHQSTSCVRYPAEQKMKRHEGHPSQGRDLFKSVAPLTTTYWSDSFSD